MYLYYGRSKSNFCKTMLLAALQGYISCLPAILTANISTDTVPLKSKLTLETRTSRLDPRASMLETFEDRVSSIESRVSRIESRGSRNKAFSNMQKLERVSRKRFISRRKNNTVLLTPTVKYKCFASIVIA